MQCGGGAQIYYFFQESDQFDSMNWLVLRITDGVGKDEYNEFLWTNFKYCVK